MTRWGDKIPDISLAELQDGLAEAENGKAVKRLIAAIEYKHGLTPAKIEEKYGIPEHTAYTWLDRFEDMEFEEALHDDARPGKAPILTASQLDTLKAALAGTPRNVGYSADAWDSTIAHDYIEREFGVDYSRRHVRRLMNVVQG